MLETASANFVRLMLSNAQRPVLETLPGFPGGDTPCLVWYGGPSGQLAPRENQRWAWPILTNTPLRKIFDEDRNEVRRSPVWFIGTHSSWPLVVSREAMKEMFGKEQFIAVFACGALMPLGLACLSEDDGLIKPAAFVDIPSFVDFLSR